MCVFIQCSHVRCALKELHVGVIIAPVHSGPKAALSMLLHCKK